MLQHSGGKTALSKLSDMGRFAMGLHCAFATRGKVAKMRTIQRFKRIHFLLILIQMGSFSTFLDEFAKIYNEIYWISELLNTFFGFMKT